MSPTPRNRATRRGGVVPNAPQTGDTTRWFYDEPSGCITNKVYADGKGPSYTYTPDGKLATRTWARGIVTTYTYDNAGNLTRTEYSDNGITPLFDADGNQTRVKTATGIWSVTYNGENRPILWICGATNIVMAYDRMGRRVTKNDQRFVYGGYLQISNHRSTPTLSTVALAQVEPSSRTPFARLPSPRPARPFFEDETEKRSTG